MTQTARPALARRTGEVLVASVPANHVYVHHLSPPAGDDGVRRLPDPSPDDSLRSAEQHWWPPVMLDPAWIADADFDVFHVHFGFDAWEPDRLDEVVAALRRRDKPLVYTVHDLRNPHHEDRSLHDAQLDVLIPAADALITLTHGAAAEVERRWGRRPSVVPHPHVVPLDDIGRLGAVVPRPGRGPRVGLHVKSVRAGMDPVRLLPTLVAAVEAVPGAVLQVNGHREVLEEGAEAYDATLAAAVAEAATSGSVDLRVHDFMADDDQFFAYLAGLDVSVLPYRFGTHSGWLEACRDVGTTVVAPTCGYYADQAPILSYGRDEDSFDQVSLRDAVHRALASPGLGRVTAPGRRRQREDVARFHHELYRSLARSSTSSHPARNASRA